ncbi:conserved hypothetical protein [Actinopolyspora mzabensis]|uniref:DUF4440 domain-containing protein n=1 Tax=Actinopolyspora mzabensis TaxID=995066 RepID=A0A1G8Y7G0_ACTMZ|nr:SgcJ/EcaC family oxidoreductase [Actinopolyspora mzabensis]SDJ98135.1 conserved hypothetical protein [Actinopolyspora mzabensis]
MPTTTSWGSAARILAESGVAEDTSFFGPFTGTDERAVLTVPMRIQAAWSANDPDAFAEVFAENGSLLLQDNQLVGKERIRQYMNEGFRGDLRGACVTGWPLEVRFLDTDVAMVVTEGGIVLAGEQELATQRRIRAVWVIVKRTDGSVKLLSHQSSPVGG